MYLIRLDDASEYMDYDKWEQIESILDKYNIRPLVCVVPCVKDSKIMFEFNDNFEDILQEWKIKGWKFALHGYDHVLHKGDRGLNPVNNFSEFVGLNLENQKDKIRGGICT